MLRTVAIGVSGAPAANVEMPKGWHLLVAICFFMPMAAAFPSARVAGAGLRGIVIILALSLALGFACAWLLDTVRKMVGARVTGNTRSLPQWHSPALYVAATLWMVMVWGLGLWMSAAVLQRLR
jgi:hypothetical protein